MRRFLAVLMVTVCFIVAVTLRAQSNFHTRIIQASHDVAIPPELRKKLSNAADIEAFLRLPNHDAVVVYDTVSETDNANFMDNDPHFAIFRGGVALLNTDSGAPVGPVRFHGMAAIPISDEASVLAFAFQLGGDGAGTFFVFVGQKPGGYGAVATLEGVQAQLRFREGSPGTFVLWTADGWIGRGVDATCVWCPKYYKLKKYAWENGKPQHLSTVRTRQGFKPETFDDSPFLITK